MLTVEPAARKRKSRHQVGLAMAGGGPLGAFYQLGALHAISECTIGLDLTRLHGYVGVSSGAIISACLANGLSTHDMIRAFFVEDDSAEFPLTPGMLMQPALREYGHRLTTVPALIGQSIVQWARDPLRQSWASLLSPLLNAIPTGAFDNRPFEHYLRQLLSADGRTNDFRKLGCTLRIVATDLNSGTEVRFGDPGFDDVPISEAIRASTALPGLYTPVKIGGRTYVDGALLRTVNASVVLEKGADLVISVNPLVTFDGTIRGEDGRTHDLAERGLMAVLGQTFRALIQSRMQIGMQRYRSLYPGSDRVVLEPDRHDQVMFFSNVFRYSDRALLGEHAYQCTREDLRAQLAEIEPIFARHGITFDHQRLEDPARHFLTSTNLESAASAAVLDKLGGTLESLTQWLATEA